VARVVAWLERNRNARLVYYDTNFCRVTVSHDNIGFTLLTPSNPDFSSNTLPQQFRTIRLLPKAPILRYLLISRTTRSIRQREACVLSYLLPQSLTALSISLFTNTSPQTPAVMMNFTIMTFSALALMTATAQAGPVGYGICQAGCSAVVMACYAAGGATWGATAGATAPATIAACNSAFGTCQAACAAVLLAPTP